jgi:hypothetical protein
MPLASKLFAAYAFVLLLVAFSCPYIFPVTSEVTFRLRGITYGFPPASVCVWLATVSCCFAAAYSFYMLPFSRAAEIWHFGITAVAISLTLISFYWLFVAIPDDSRRGDLTGVNYALACVLLTAPIFALAAQGIFILNFLRAVARKP